MNTKILLQVFLAAALAIIMACGSEDGDNDKNRPDGGGGDTTCAVNEECSTGYCQIPAGAFEGSCQAHDLGTPCFDNTECTYDICVGFDPNDPRGSCTLPCQESSDCPDDVRCEFLANSGFKACIPE